MTKKHFILLAKALADTRPDKAEYQERVQWLKDVEAVMNVCDCSNEQFNNSMFVRACKEERECR